MTNEEWTRNRLRSRPEHAAQIRYTLEKVNHAVADCLVTGDEHRIDGIELPDRDDRHLLAAALKGDQTLFAREDIVELAWKVVDPALAGNFPTHPDEPKTWGPGKADSVLLGDTTWHNPATERHG